ncbi:MAG TPA: hypothetical protein VF789_22420 [Thermoanaerobaculia bacterium]
MKSAPLENPAKCPGRKLHLNRETLRMLTDQELEGVAAGAPTHSPRCTTFSEPSLCVTCLCT